MTTNTPTATGSGTQGGTNIEPSVQQPPPWDPNDPAESLEALRSYVEGQALRAVGWYYRKKVSKARLSGALRFLAIVFTAIGAIIPLFVAALPAQPVGGVNWSQFGYVAIAIGGLFLALDRFTGSSSGWMRYIATAMKIETLLEEFRLDWWKLKAEATSPLSSAALVVAIDRLTTFTMAVRSEVEKETQAWVTEFQSNLSQLEKETNQALENARELARKQAEELAKVQQTATARSAGAVNLTVKGAPPEGFTVELDGTVYRTGVTGNVFGLRNVTPGLREIGVSATLNGQARHFSKVVTVEGSKVLDVTIELA